MSEERERYGGDIPEKLWPSMVMPPNCEREVPAEMRDERLWPGLALGDGLERYSTQELEDEILSRIERT